MAKKVIFNKSINYRKHSVSYLVRHICQNISIINEGLHYKGVDLKVKAFYEKIAGLENITVIWGFKMPRPDELISHIKIWEENQSLLRHRERVCRFTSKHLIKKCTPEYLEYFNARSHRPLQKVNKLRQ